MDVGKNDYPYELRYLKSKIILHGDRVNLLVVLFVSTGLFSIGKGAKVEGA